MDEVNEHLKGYRVGRPIGRGARSVVYEVWRKGDERRLAAKYVAVREEADRNIVRHLENEYRVLCRLHEGGDGKSTQGIVQPVELRKIRRFFKLRAACLILEWVEGKSLADVRDYRLGDLVSIFEQVCDSLMHVHRKGLVHADLKPDNIVVGPALCVKLIDFGFAAPIGRKLRGLKGTWGYLAPEQAGGELSAQTDVFNLGAAMYWVFTGDKLPAIVPQGGDRRGFMPAGDLPLTPPRKLRPELPGELSELIMRCCEANPAERPAMGAVKRMLHNLSLRCSSVT